MTWWFIAKAKNRFMRFSKGYGQDCRSVIFASTKPKPGLCTARIIERRKRKSTETSLTFWDSVSNQECIVRYGIREMCFWAMGSEMSQKVITKVVTDWKQRKWHRQGGLSLQDIATRINTQMRGLINYFGKINSIGLHKLIRQFHFQLAKWTMNKYKRFRARYGKAYTWLKEIKNFYPTMFYHWTVYNWI
jgi:hypothetical protein